MYVYKSVIKSNLINYTLSLNNSGMRTIECPNCHEDIYPEKVGNLCIVIKWIILKCAYIHKRHRFPGSLVKG